MTELNERDQICALGERAQELSPMWNVDGWRAEYCAGVML